MPTQTATLNPQPPSVPGDLLAADLNHLTVYRRPGVGCHAADASGYPWGTWNGGPPEPCTACGTIITHGWRGGTWDVAGPVLCCTHVRLVPAEGPGA